MTATELSSDVIPRSIRISRHIDAEVVRLASNEQRTVSHQYIQLVREALRARAAAGDYRDEHDQGLPW
jgi:hypothetical protein